MRLASTTFTFTASGSDDPKPVDNELAKRFGRCLMCNRIIHFSRPLIRWIYDDGTFHTGHLVEFPIEWVIKKERIKIKIETRRTPIERDNRETGQSSH